MIKLKSFLVMFLVVLGVYSAEEATDFIVNDYDGKETVYAVINGKIKEIVPKMW